MHLSALPILGGHVWIRLLGVAVLMFVLVFMWWCWFSYLLSKHRVWTIDLWDFLSAWLAYNFIVSFLLVITTAWSVADCSLIAPGSWLNFELMLLCVWSLACCLHVHVGYLWVLLFPPTSQKHTIRLNGGSKLPLGVPWGPKVWDHSENLEFFSFIWK